MPKEMIRAALSLIILGFLIWLYTKWVTIPVYRHYYQAEYLWSGQGETPVKSTLSIYDNRGFSLYSMPSKDIGEGRNRLYSHEYSFHKPFTKDTIWTTPLFSSEERSIADILGDDLYQELCTYCEENNIDIQRYDEYGYLFYFCHFNNADMYHSKKRQISHGGGGIYIHGTNDFTTSNIKGSEEYHKYPYGIMHDSVLTIGKKLLKKYKYCNLQEGYVLKLGLDDFYTGGSSLIPYNSFCGLLRKTIQLHDISRVYYELTLVSKSIPNMNCFMEFSSSINYKATNLNANGISSDLSNIAITNPYKYSPAYASTRISVDFEDMRSLQNMRLTLLAAVISIVLSLFISNIGKLLKKRKRCNLYRTNHHQNNNYHDKD